MLEQRAKRFPTAVELRIETETGPESVRLANVSRTGGKAVNLPLVIEGEHLRFVFLGGEITARVTRLGPSDEVGFAFERPISEHDLSILRNAGFSGPLRDAQT